MHRLVLLVLLIACGGAARKPDAAARPDAPAPPPPPTTQPVLLVANKADNTVSVLELPGGRALATLPTGEGPHEIAVTRDGRRAVITNYGTQATLGRSLTVIDLPTLAVVKTIDLGEYRRPHGVAYLADDRRVIVTSEANQAVIVVDTEAGTVDRGIPTAQQGTHMLALTGDRSRAYTANIGSGTVTAIDLATLTAIESKPAIAACEGVAVTIDGSEVWTASLKEHRIVVLDAPALAPDGGLAAAPTPIRVVATPDGRSMLVTSVNGSSLQIIDVATRAVQTVAFTPRAGPTAAPVGTVVAPDSATAYVALVAEDRVAVVDLASRTVTAHLPTGRGPDGIGYSAAFVR